MQVCTYYVYMVIYKHKNVTDNIFWLLAEGTA